MQLSLSSVQQGQIRRLHNAVYRRTFSDCLKKHTGFENIKVNGADPDQTAIMCNPILIYSGRKSDKVLFWLPRLMLFMNKTQMICFMIKFLDKCSLRSACACVGSIFNVFLTSQLTSVNRNVIWILRLIYIYANWKCETFSHKTFYI